MSWQQASSVSDRNLEIKVPFRSPSLIKKNTYSLSYRRCNCAKEALSLTRVISKYLQENEIQTKESTLHLAGTARG